MFLEVRALFSDLKNRKNPQNFRFLGMKSTFFRFEKPETFSYFSGNYRGKNTVWNTPGPSRDAQERIPWITHLSFLTTRTRFFRGVTPVGRLARVDPGGARAPEYFYNIVPYTVIAENFFQIDSRLRRTSSRPPNSIASVIYIYIYVSLWTHKNPYFRYFRPPP